MKQLYTILAEEGIHVNIALRVLDSMEKYALENLEDIDTAKKKIYDLDIIKELRGE